MVRAKPGQILGIAALLTMLGVAIGLLLVPTPMRQSGHWCPSLFQAAALGPNPSRQLKTELGMPLGSFYYACTRNGTIARWALLWLAVFIVAALLMVVVLGRLRVQPLAAKVKGGHRIGGRWRGDRVVPSDAGDSVTARPEPGTGPDPG